VSPRAGFKGRAREGEEGKKGGREEGRKGGREEGKIREGAKKQTARAVAPSRRPSVNRAALDYGFLT
jgi:hypothetical protein